ncbi:prepilin peptidase [Candidatus Woesearchaeota archaeon]|nr:prepilin peptidase [Candidatus Woesearchaeota archaeon]
MGYLWLGSNLMPSIITFTISFIALAIGSITDLKTREVPDWVNYGMVFTGLGLNLLFSIIYSNSSFIINSLLGLAIFFGIAYIMFYAGQWGGGDSKMLMGLGAMIGIDAGALPTQFLSGFIVNALFVGAVYGLLWSFCLVLKNRKKFWVEFTKALSEKNAVKIKKLLLVLMALLLALFFITDAYSKILILSLAFLALSTFYLWIFVKTVEKTCMHKLVEPSKLTEGDWIVNDVYAKEKYITGPKDLGVSKSQIRKLTELYEKGKIKKILIKEGIPFVPSFLVAFVTTLIFGNPLVLLV